MTVPGPSTAPVERFRRDLENLAGDVGGRLGIAVSGGPDSLALLLLAQAAFPKRVEAATVDHGLRPESAAEADFVAAICKGLAVVHATLRPIEPIEGNVQSAARIVRYQLLEAWRRERGLDWVLTAHHSDDQAETLLMRLNRGSGVGGLSGVRAINGNVLRPLLGWRRLELASIVEAGGIDAVDDPSNAEERFDRVRIRRNLGHADWIDPTALARSAAALAQAEEALEWTAARLEADRVAGTEAKFQVDVRDVPEELRRRLILRTLRRIDPAAEPRGDALARLLETLEGGGTATLAGIRCAGGEIWHFEPAPPRRSG
jgi:tRNA(Ile)-lysidine synthase